MEPTPRILTEAEGILRRAQLKLVVERALDSMTTLGRTHALIHGTSIPPEFDPRFGGSYYDPERDELE